jgi:hypothetical protein
MTMPQALPATSAPQRPMPWPALGWATALVFAITVWQGEWVLTQGVMDRLLGLDASAASGDALTLQRQLTRVGYALVPVIVIARCTFAALVVQGTALFVGVELSFRDALHAAAIGFLAVGAQLAVQTLTIALVPVDSLVPLHLQLVPGSLAQLLGATEVQSLLWSALNAVTIWEVAWMLFVTEALRGRPGLSGGRAAATAAAAGGITMLLMWLVTAGSALLAG